MSSKSIKFVCKDLTHTKNSLALICLKLSKKKMQVNKGTYLIKLKCFCICNEDLTNLKHIALISQQLHKKLCKNNNNNNLQFKLLVSL